MEQENICKTCKICNITKPINDFIVYRRICKLCMKPLQRERYINGNGLKHNTRVEKPITIKNPVGRPRKIKTIENDL
jgi:hypothetical protein